MSIADNLDYVRARVAAAARRAGSNGEVSIIAVTKSLGPEVIGQAYDAGQRLFGENRVQEFAAKAPAFGRFLGAEFHLIGHLQSNKAAKAAELFSAIDSLDSLHLARKLNAAAEKLDKSLPVLIEINVGGESGKSGIRVPEPPDSAELEELLSAAPNLKHLVFRGLMTIPPFAEDPQAVRPYFRMLRQLREMIAKRSLPGISMDVLSMGMSHDFEIAIEEGATCVRIGTAIFGERPTWTGSAGTET